MLVYPRSSIGHDLATALRIAERAVELGMWPKVRVFTSPMTACVVVTHLDISAVKNPHVTEWADTFMEQQ
jgi:hypothetical protein